jgi:hypothetical protein
MGRHVDWLPDAARWRDLRMETVTLQRPDAAR